MAHMQRVTPCPWFDDQGEDAANLYVSVFPNSKIVRISRYGEAGKETHGRPPGSVMTRDTVETALQLLPTMRPGAAVWDTEAFGAPRRHVTRWLLQRAAGAERIFRFVYHLPYDDTESEWTRFGRYPVNIDDTPRPDGVALHTLSDRSATRRRSRTSPRASATPPSSPRARAAPARWRSPT